MMENQDIFIFSLSDWSEEMVSNRYQIATRFARKNRVFFFERPIIPWKCDFKRWPEYFAPVQEIQKNLYVVKPPSALSYEAQKTVSIYYVKTLMAAFNVKKPIFWFYDFQGAYLIDFFQPEAACFHCTEDYEGVSILNGSKYKLETLRLEGELSQKADLIFAVSEEICRKHKKINPATFTCLNAVDFQFYARAQNKKEITKNKVIGLVGNLSKIIDFKLLEYVAKKLPQVTLRLIGPVTADNPYLKLLKKMPNVEFIPKQKIEKLPDLLSKFDVCLMAYIQDGWFKKAAQPLKLFEYLATGKPIVSTPLDCLKKLGGLVYVGQDPKEYLQQVKMALKEDNKEKRQKRIRLASKNTWEDRFKLINDKIEKFLANKKVEVKSPPTLQEIRQKNTLNIFIKALEPAAKGETLNEGQKNIKSRFHGFK